MKRMTRYPPAMTCTVSRRIGVFGTVWTFELYAVFGGERAMIWKLCPCMLNKH
jgi:hypothetical protein